MTDEMYVFRQTERERKIISRGAYRKKGGSKSKKCTLPSDMLTRKEREALNGEVKVYNMSKPMSWESFRALPVDLQKEYMIMLTSRLGASRRDVAEMFSIPVGRLSGYLCYRHPGEHFFEGKETDQDRFLKWYCGESVEEMPVAATPEEVKESEVTAPEEVEETETTVPEEVEETDAERIEEEAPVVEEQAEQIESDVVRIEEVFKKKATFKSTIEHGKLEFCGSARDIFERVMMILGEEEMYRIVVEVDRMDAADNAVA